MMYLISPQRPNRFSVQDSTGIATIETFRFQPVLRIRDVRVLAEGRSANSEQAEGKKGSLHLFFE